MSRTAMQSQIQLAEKFGANNYAPLPVVLHRGEGALVWDVEGNRYFDMLSAYSAVNQGHCHSRLVNVMMEQCSKLTLTSRAFHNDKMGPMLERISEVTGFEKVIPMNTGAEGVETAIKIMRRWGYDKKDIPEDFARIIVVDGNFHGRTTTIIGFSSDEGTKRGFGPFTQGFVSIPFGDAEALKKAVNENTVGVLIEPIQGEAGVIIPPENYLAEVKRICQENEIIFCLDEIQSGLGRTGKMFAWEHFDARPDMIILGKALSGGFYPVSCVATSEEIMGVLDPGSHGSTYGGNPLAAVLAVEALNIIEDEHLVKNAADRGIQFIDTLKERLDVGIKEIRGKGLMVAVEFPKPVAHDAAVALMGEGVLAKDTHDTTIRFAPPLVISAEQLDEALQVIIPVLNTFI